MRPPISEDDVERVAAELGENVGEVGVLARESHRHDPATLSCEVAAAYPVLREGAGPPYQLSPRRIQAAINKRWRLLGINQQLSLLGLCVASRLAGLSVARSIEGDIMIRNLSPTRVLYGDSDVVSVEMLATWIEHMAKTLVQMLDEITRVNDDLNRRLANENRWSVDELAEHLSRIEGDIARMEATHRDASSLIAATGVAL